MGHGSDPAYNERVLNWPINGKYIPLANCIFHFHAFLVPVLRLEPQVGGMGKTDESRRGLAVAVAYGAISIWLTFFNKLLLSSYSFKYERTLAVW